MRRTLVSLLGPLAVIAAACGNAGTGTLAIVDSWAPPTPPNAPAAVIYLTIDNDSDTDDRLLTVSSDRCGSVELHATQIDENRVMRMRPAEPEALRIPASDRLEMVPGALHVMCIGLPSPFVDGEQLELVATLEQAGDIPVTVPVEHR